MSPRVAYRDGQEDSRLVWAGKEPSAGAGQEFSIWEVGRDFAICW